LQSEPRPPADAGNSDLILALLATVIGLVVRASAPLQATFPLNDGGLFYRMILDLQANRFVLPPFTTYNFSNIPFAYPPLAFYATGLLASIFHLDVLELIRVLPSLLSSASVPVYYFLSRQVLRSGQGLALVATLAFALVPRGFDWQIMGGGITRALGFVFGLATLFYVHRLFSHDGFSGQIFPPMIFGALTVLSHPEASVQTALAVLIFYLVLDRSRQGALQSLAVALGILFLTSPWWATVLLQHGIDPFLASASAVQNGTSFNLATRIYLTLQFNFTEEPFLQLIAVFGLIGLFSALMRREYLLPLWLVAPLLLEPRSAPQFMVIPLGMLASLGLVQVVLVGLRVNQQLPARLAGRLIGGVLVFLFIYALYSSYLVGLNLAASLELQPADRDALGWVRTNTPVNSRFILLTRGGPLVDPLAEWFPALTNQKSLNTVFGTEWLREEPFDGVMKRYETLQLCLNRDEVCLQEWAAANEQNYSYVLIDRRGFDPVLAVSLRNSPAYKLVYESSKILIFQKIS
jgi:hypothetical protein